MELIKYKHRFSLKNNIPKESNGLIPYRARNGAFSWTPSTGQVTDLNKLFARRCRPSLEEVSPRPSQQEEETVRSETETTWHAITSAACFSGSIHLGRPCEVPYRLPLSRLPLPIQTPCGGSPKTYNGNSAIPPMGLQIKQVAAPVYSGRPSHIWQLSHQEWHAAARNP